jgi:hypothetical protein
MSSVRQTLTEAAARKEAFEYGKQYAAEHIFAEIDALHLHVSNEYEARAYEKLKEKWGVSKNEERP